MQEFFGAILLNEEMMDLLEAGMYELDIDNVGKFTLHAIDFTLREKYMKPLNRAYCKMGYIEEIKLGDGTPIEFNGLAFNFFNTAYDQITRLAGGHTQREVLFCILACIRNYAMEFEVKREATRKLTETLDCSRRFSSGMQGPR